MTTTTDNDMTSGGYVDAYRAAAERLPGHDLDWLRAMRSRAIKSFAASGFPSRRSEEWRYTSLTPLKETVFLPGFDSPAPSTAGTGLALSELAAPRLVFVNGRFDRALSRLSALPEGLEILDLNAALAAEQPLLMTAFEPDDSAARAIRSLNTAFVMDGLVIRITGGAHLAEPIHIAHIVDRHMTGRAAHLHHVIVAGPGSRATFVESFSGTAGPYWTNMVSDVTLAPGAQVESFKIEQDGRQGVHLAETSVHLEAGADYSNFCLLTGGQVARNEIRLAFTGENATARLNGIYLAGNGQSHEIATLVDHATPMNTSHQAYKGVLGAGAHGTFQGRVIVRPGAQGTNADQSNHNLMLDRSADVNTKPELEIYADDVKCTHGATVGELDPAQMFYLKTRGLDEATARNMLVEAFIISLIDGISRPDVHALVKSTALSALAANQGGGHE